MKYSTLVHANGKDHYQIAEAIYAKEMRNSSFEDKRVIVYAPESVKVSDGVTVVPANRIVFADVLSLILDFDTLRNVPIFPIPREVVFIIPECDRYMRYVGIELLQNVINQLVYSDVKMYFIADDNGEVSNRLEYEEVVNEKDL